jgi:glutamate-1-semialdehyde 2,1-aminomutase
MGGRSVGLQKSSANSTALSNFRYWGDDRTIYVAHGKGGRLFDIDGNSYVDYRLGYGPAILGYADPRIDEAARRGMEIGGVFALSTTRELAVAERIAGMVPAAELVRFSNSGTEAVMAGLRLARAVTGKESHVLIEGSYHGLFDSALWMKDLANWDPHAHAEPVTVPYSQGVPRGHRRACAPHADERCAAPRGSVEAAPRLDCGHVYRADHGKLLRHLGDP